MVSCVSGSCNSVRTTSGRRIRLVLRTCVFMYRTWTTLLSVITATRICAQATRAQPVARRAMYSVSEIPSKRSFVCQKVLCWEPSLSASFCHFQRQTLIQGPLWMCAFTGRRREVAWFQMRMVLLLRETRPYGLKRFLD